jgi:hypothetical protein
VSAESIAVMLRKDEKFSQGARLYAVCQVALGGRKSKELQSVYNTTLSKNFFYLKLQLNFAGRYQYNQ